MAPPIYELLLVLLRHVRLDGEFDFSASTHPQQATLDAATFNEAEVHDAKLDAAGHWTFSVLAHDVAIEGIKTRNAVNIEEVVNEYYARYGDRPPTRSAYQCAVFEGKTVIRKGCDRFWLTDRGVKEGGYGATLYLCGTIYGDARPDAPYYVEKIRHIYHTTLFIMSCDTAELKPLEQYIVELQAKNIHFSPKVRTTFAKGVDRVQAEAVIAALGLTIVEE